jgi:triacylglycerol lipase
MLKSDRNSVLLIHGIEDTSSVFNKMSAYLTREGWKVHSLDLCPNDGSDSLVRLANQVKDYIDTTYEPHHKIDLIGFSMGGIVTRYYLQRLGGINKVQRYINISAPNNGTLTAYFRSSPGVLQMRPDSKLLQNLNRDAADLLTQINFSILWTPFDLMIVPPTSSKMPVGKEISLPVLIHPWMLKDSRVLNQVKNLLLEPVINEQLSTNN